jgi:hypothetical protein
MARRPPSAVDLRGDNGMSISAPGAYLHVLQQRCARELDDERGSLALTGACAQELAAEEAQHRERVAARVEVRRATGEPVNAHSWQLPRGLPAPFEHWPRDGQRRFTVTARDTITLRPRPEGN